VLPRLACKHGVHLLECGAIDIDGVRLASTTLWTPDDPRFASAISLATARADVIVTHFKPRRGHDRRLERGARGQHRVWHLGNFAYQIKRGRLSRGSLRACRLRCAARSTPC
jgi:hypothetical protein